MMQLAFYFALPIIALSCFGFNKTALFLIRIIVFVIITLVGVVGGGLLTVMNDPSAAHQFGDAWTAAGIMPLTAAKIESLTTLTQAMGLPFFFVIDIACAIFLFAVVCGGLAFWVFVLLAAFAGVTYAWFAF